MKQSKNQVEGNDFNDVYDDDDDDNDNNNKFWVSRTYS